MNTDSWRQYVIALLYFNAHRKYGTQNKDGSWTTETRANTIDITIKHADKLLEAENNLWKRRKNIEDNVHANLTIKTVFSKGCK